MAVLAVVLVFFAIGIWTKYGPGGSNRYCDEVKALQHDPVLNAERSSEADWRRYASKVKKVDGDLVAAHGFIGVQIHVTQLAIAADGAAEEANALGRPVSSPTILTSTLDSLDAEMNRQCG